MSTKPLWQARPAANQWPFRLSLPSWILSTFVFIKVVAPLYSQTADGFDPGVTNTGSFSVIAVQPDGKVLVGGLFVELNGQTRNGFGRLNPDGSLDNAFDPKPIGPFYGPGLSSTTVDSIILQPDGKILISGSFTNLSGKTRQNLGRLNRDGTLDDGFNPAVGGNVYGLALQADGKILVGGLFTNLAGGFRTNMGRLNFDGTLDPEFHPEVDGSGGGFLLQSDGKILVSGNFTNLAGEVRMSIGRLNPDGTLDASFNAQASRFTSCRAIQPDGKILVTGQFTQIGGYPIKYVARLNTDGTVDEGFNSAFDFFGVNVGVQTDGRLLVGGGFTNVAGQVRRALARLNSDGTLDTNFNAQLARFTFGPLVVVNFPTVQADGKILVAGSFTHLAGEVRHSIGRLNSAGPATQSLTFDGATITWLRGGVSPEVYRTSFDFSTDGVNWISLGAGARIAGGWQCTNVSIPRIANIRARGFVSHGRSQWFVESTTRPMIAMNDGSFGIRSNQFGFNVGGIPGQVVVVESSSNTNDWVTVATNIIGNGPVYFSDPDPASSVWRLYRARTQ